MVGIDAFDDTCPPQRFETTHMRADESVGIALDALDLGRDASRCSLGL